MCCVSPHVRTHAHAHVFNPVRGGDPHLSLVPHSSLAPSVCVCLGGQVASLETLLRGSQQENVRLLDQYRLEKQRHLDAEAAQGARVRSMGNDEDLRFELDKLRREKRELQFQVGPACTLRPPPSPSPSPPPPLPSSLARSPSPLRKRHHHHPLPLPSPPTPPLTPYLHSVSHAHLSLWAAAGGAVRAADGA
jgi:hypothetical protein